MDERGRACVPGKRVNWREEEKINRLSICIQLIWSHSRSIRTPMHRSRSMIFLPRGRGARKFWKLYGRKNMTTDPSVQRRQLIDEEPSNSSFAIERAIDRNRAFAILFINVLPVPRIYCAKSKNSDFCTFEILFRFAQWNFWNAYRKGRTKKIVGKL